MPVPFPTDGSANLRPPDEAEVRHTMRGLATAVAPAGGLTLVQRSLLQCLVHSMTGVEIDPVQVEPIDPDDFAEGLRDRNRWHRIRLLQVMELCELILVPLPPEVTERVERFADALGVEDAMMRVARHVSTGSLGLAMIDFERSGYTSGWAPSHSEALHTSKALEQAWDLCVDDPELAERWDLLGNCPPGSIGRGVWEFYRARGFRFPGEPGSAPPYLAQHDWVHVLADYGSTVECEIEVFGLISRANDNPEAFSLLAMVIGLFETGYLPTAANLFEADRGHLSAGTGMAARLADAMRRGATMRESDRLPRKDLLAIDWFAIADVDLAELRAEFNVMHRSPKAVAAGSVTPWQPGGITPHQLRCGQELAEREGRTYQSYGAAIG